MAKRGKTPDTSAGPGHDDPPYRAVVGVGASAGGLDALIELFDALPGDTGAAFVVAFHLDPASVSHLTEILARHTPMPVHEAEDGTAVEADRVYVGLPGRTLAFRGGELRVERLEERPQEAWSLDALFLSLAEELGPRAVAVVLSGSGAHGVAGAGHVRAAAGLVIARTPTPPSTAPCRGRWSTPASRTWSSPPGRSPAP